MIINLIVTKVVHEIHSQTRSGVIQVIEELGDVITSLENSINTLDEETSFLESSLKK